MIGKFGKFIISGAADLLIGTFATTLGNAFYEVSYYCVDTICQIYNHKKNGKK